MARNTLRARAWAVLRARQGQPGTLGCIAAASLTGGEKNPLAGLLPYFNALCKAGLVICVPRRDLTAWSLVQDVGPQAPVWRRSRQQVFDPNSNTVFSLISNQGTNHG